MEAKRVIFFRRQVVVFVAAVIGAVVCLTVSPMYASAALGPVKACTYSANGKVDTACAPNVYLGESFSYECASADTPLPVGANAATGKYCAEPLDESSSTCGDTQTLPATVGVATATSGVVTVRVNFAWDVAFKDVISFNVRCTKSGAKTFIAAKLWPFSKPMYEEPRKACVLSTDTGSTAFNPCRFYIFQSDTTAKTFDCRPSTGTLTLVPSDFYNGGSGNVCTTGLATSGNPACLSSASGTWTSTVPGLTVASAHSNKAVSLTGGSLTKKRAEAFLGCYTNAGAALFARGWFFKSAFAALDKAHAGLIKHVCTPPKGSKVDTPCEVTLAGDEAVVLQCAPYATNAKYTLMPADTNTAAGSFCTSKPADFKDNACADSKKWSTDAQAAVSEDPSLDFILVAQPKAMADKLKAEVTAYGFCSDQKDGLAWKLTFGKGKASDPDDDSKKNGAAPRSSYVALGAGSILVASFLAATVA